MEGLLEMHSTLRVDVSVEETGKHRRTPIKWFSGVAGFGNNEVVIDAVTDLLTD
jgi:hypothetical protein